MISHFIHLLLSMWFLLLVSTLHTLVVATSDKPWTSFAVVKNNLLLTRVCMKFEYITRVPYFSCRNMIHFHPDLFSISHAAIWFHPDLKSISCVMIWFRPDLFDFLGLKSEVFWNFCFNACVFNTFRTNLVFTQAQEIMDISQQCTNVGLPYV